ncbi:MAG: beta-L-arabinofuranosidase domain-containing protein, partial [Candidatus Caldatribacteriaceae bacterium]
MEERGKNPLYFEVKAQAREEEKKPWPFWSPEYCQAHLPVREQKEAVGHAVRAMYLYSAMADLAWEGQDEPLLATCLDLWHSVTKRQMHITGGIGSSAKGESFTFDHDLPPDRSYNETYAVIGLFLWAHRMLEIEKDSQYTDVMEKVLFNGILAGVSLDGKRYFYVNPLEVWPKAVSKRADLNHVVLTRQPWFPCACCPPNLARLLAALGKYLYGQDGSVLYVHLFEKSSVTTT